MLSESVLSPVALILRPFNLPKVMVMLAIILMAQFILPSGSEAQTGCCTVAGNINCSADEKVNLADLTVLIDHIWLTKTPLCCAATGNVDRDLENKINLADVVKLIDFIYLSKTPLEPCGDIELTFAQREIVFNAVDSVYDSFLGMPDDSLAIALAAFLNTLPEIDTAAVIDSVSVWGLFSDGRILSIPNNRFPDAPPAPDNNWSQPEYEAEVPAGFVLPKPHFDNWDYSSVLLPEPTASAPQAPGDYELPESIQATVISSLSPTCFTQSVPTIKKLLDDHGYLTTQRSGSVSSLLNIDGDGVFYMDAHGGPARDSKDSTANFVLGIWTTTLFSEPTDSTYAGLLRRHELVYMMAKDVNPFTGACEVHFRYAYTGKFVAQYMYFAPNSLIFINACESDSIASLRQGFFTAGASVFCGWSKTVRVAPSNKAAEFLFDRLMGANDSKLSPKESPPQRAFDVDRLWQDMKNRGYDTDPSNGSKLRVERLQNHFGLLAPSIRYMNVLENTDSLFLYGMFGSDPGSKGRVIVGGSELPILDWQSDLVVANIPNAGAGSAGPVTVEVDGLMGPSYSVKRKSNSVNLSEWRGQFIYTDHEAGSLISTIILNAHFRSDIHSFRQTPHTPPEMYSLIVPVADDSYGTVEVS